MMIKNQAKEKWNIVMEGFMRASGSSMLNMVMES
jgi:hypothetical protein